MKFHTIRYVIFENLSRKFKFHSNLTTVTGTSHKTNIHTLMIVSRSVLLRMRNVLDRSCTENQNAHFKLNNVFRKSCLL